jgi:hypothetical protein
MARAASGSRRLSRAGDLFEHFGVETGRESKGPAAIVAAAPCSTCGWLRPLDELERACPLCAALPGSER